MNRIRIIINSLILFILVSCCTINGNKICPEYRGVNPQVAPIVDQWLLLAKEHGLKFNKTITVGFKNIKEHGVVGLSNYGIGFREINLDMKYWNNSTSISRTILLYHELTHSYCNRGHDYGNGKKYKDAKEITEDPKKDDGFFQDECPLTIMFPVVLDDSCFMSHYQEYIDEMFNRCEEW